MQIHVPGAARHGLRKSQETGRLALYAHGDQQCRPYLQLREALRLRRLLLARRAGVAQLRETQVIQAPLEPRKGVDGRALQPFRATLRKGAASELHIFDDELVRVKGDQKGTIAARGIP